MKSSGDGGEEPGLSSRTAASEKDTQSVEFERLWLSCDRSDEAEQLRRNGMEDDIEPAPDAVLRRVLPRLQAIAMS